MTQKQINDTEALTKALRKNCPYSELFWSAFSRIRTRISPNTDTFHSVMK